jgi:hypothetical protein
MLGLRSIKVPAAAALLVISPASPCHADFPRPEHPRPDFQRESWLNLNGEWQFEVDPNAEGEQRGWISGRDLAQRIVVPFCPESKLSGLGLAANYLPHAQYRPHLQVLPLTKPSPPSPPLDLANAGACFAAVRTATALHNELTGGGGAA